MGVVVDLVTTKGKNRRMKIIVALVAITGTLLAANVFESIIALHPLGIMFGLLAAISFTVFIYFSNRLGHETHVIIKSKYHRLWWIYYCTLLLEYRYSKFV